MKITNFSLTKRDFRASYREYSRKTRLFVFPANETVWENLENRRQRPVAEFRKVAYEALAQLGYTKSDVKLRWDIHAGCAMCACSAGFVMDFTDSKAGEGLRNKDLEVVFTY